MNKFSKALRTPKSKTTYSEGDKSKGILDDFAVRKVVNSIEGTIEHTPTNPKDITNKAYVDNVGGGTDWTVSQAPSVIHADNYTDTDTTYTSSDFTHDSLTGVDANEHLDWTIDQGATNIHSGNYTAGGTSVKSNWGYVSGDGDTSCSESVTFSTAFAAIPDIVVNCLGYKDGDPSDRGDVSVGSDYICTAQDPSTTGFTLIATDAAGGNIQEAGTTTTELDYMEYSTNALAQTAYVSSDADPANWDLLNEDCADISDWNDADSGNAVSEVSPAGQFRMDTNVQDGEAVRTRDIGSYPNILTAEIKLYHDDIGTYSGSDSFLFCINHDDVRLMVYFASDGMFIYDGSSHNEVGTNIVSEGTWQTWRFVVDFTTAASATVDVYLDGGLIASGVDCSSTGTFTDGYTNITQHGYTTDDMLTHVDYIKVATGRYPNLQSYSESTIKQQGSYSLKGIAKITDSLNDTLTRTVSPTIDLSGKTSIKIDARGSRTGNNFKLGFHDSGGTTTEHTVNIASANTWQTETVDISGVSDANKDAIDSIIITILNADAANTIYIDNIYGSVAITARRIAYSWMAKEPGTD